MYMRLKDGKRKVVTLSYDDGVVQDAKFIKILDKHGLKGTFNINSCMYVPECKSRFSGRLTLAEAQKLYMNSGHEVTIHTLTHPYLDQLQSDEMISEIIEDRKNIEREFKTIARGMAYPYGAYNDQVIEVLKQCGICYARTAKQSEEFKFPTDWMAIVPTCRHRNPKIMELAKRFVEEPCTREADNWMFYLWGHTYEFDMDDNWSLMEEFAKYIGGRDDIWYATNIEIYDYVKAYENLQTSVDKKILHNPSAIDVWVYINGQTHVVRAGETLCL